MKVEWFKIFINFSEKVFSLSFSITFAVISKKLEAFSMSVPTSQKMYYWRRRENEDEMKLIEIAFKKILSNFAYNVLKISSELFLIVVKSSRLDLKITDHFQEEIFIMKVLSSRLFSLHQSLIFRHNYGWLEQGSTPRLRELTCHGLSTSINL